jgi:hypothetical protein
MKGLTMHRTRGQSGSTLIMLIGVIAALAIMSASLVVLVMNVNANTAAERTRAKAFNMAEAGLDNGLYVLGRNWPQYSTSTTPAIDTAAFRTEFNVAEFPGTSTPIDVMFYDNLPTINQGTQWDSNGDKLMWVDSQARVGNKTVRVRALVKQENANLNLPRGVVIYAGGGLTMHGGGTPVSVAPGGLPPGATTVTAWINPPFTPHGSADFSSEVIRQSTGVPSVDDIISPDILALLKQTAIDSSPSRYFTSTAAAEAAMATGPLVYLKTTGDVTITANGVYNGDGMTVPNTTNPKAPGILIVDGGGVTFHGTGTFYGLVYCTTGFVDIGNATIKGMVISASGVSNLGGSDQIVYDDRIIVQLNNVITLAARVVPGTWRQLPTR